MGMEAILWKVRGRSKGESDLGHYLRTGRRPWSRGYDEFKEKFIDRHLYDAGFLASIRDRQPLPAKFGEFLDERVVEYPWLFSRLEPGPGRLLDAGSSLNFDFLIKHPSIKGRELTLATLAPESRCFWQQGVSYVFADLRSLPFQTDWFAEVASISTIEHVGKDNRLYASDGRFQENDPFGYLEAVKELKRVCKPGGTVYLTIPFGQFTDFGWYQQFNGAMVDRLLEAFAPARYRETYFQYELGWRLSERRACAHCQGFDIHATRYMDPKSVRDYDADFAAASRAIIALELWKGTA